MSAKQQQVRTLISPQLLPWFFHRCMGSCTDMNAIGAGDGLLFYGYSKSSGLLPMVVMGKPVNLHSCHWRMALFSRD